MKRAIAVLLLILSICMLAACAADTAAADPDTLAGSYVLADAFGEGSAAVYKLRDGIRLQIRADNTASLSLMGDVHELFFDAEKGIVTSDEDDQKVRYFFDGAQLILDTDPFRMVFERD